MKVEPINKYICIQDVPYFNISHVYEQITPNFKFSDYPKVFSQLYKFETGETTYEGQKVYRFKNVGNYELEIKSVNFIPSSHIDADIFPSFERAKKELDERKKLSENNSSKYEIKSLATQIHFLSDVNNIEELTIKDLTQKLSHIKSLSNNILKNAE